MRKQMYLKRFRFSTTNPSSRGFTHTLYREIYSPDYIDNNNIENYIAQTENLNGPINKFFEYSSMNIDSDYDSLWLYVHRKVNKSIYFSDEQYLDFTSILPESRCKDDFIAVRYKDTKPIRALYENVKLLKHYMRWLNKNNIWTPIERSVFKNVMNSKCLPDWLAKHEEFNSIEDILE